MKIVAWNVNGFRAILGKGFKDSFENLAADIFCLQETKLQPEQAQVELPGYRQYWNSAVKKGYSGTAVFTKMEPLSVQYGIGEAEHDQEGRVIALEFAEVYLVTVYTPNSQKELARLAYRLRWEAAFRTFLLALDAKKPVIVCGDLNVAHQEIDLKNPKSNRKSAGFTDAERGELTKLLTAGFTDSFRYLYPDKTGVYTWWSYLRQARDNNAGWRIDYCLVSDRIKDRIRAATIHNEIFGSDHCPVGLEMK